MKDKPIPSDYRVEIGRADQGRTFVRVVHVPTGKDRALVGIGEANAHEVALKLANELAKDIGADHLVHKPPSKLQKKKIVG